MNTKTKAVHDAISVLLQNNMNQRAFDEAIDQLIDEDKSGASRRFLVGNLALVAHRIIEGAEIDLAMTTDSEQRDRRPLPGVA